MTRVLLINGHDIHPFAKGDLNRHVANTLVTELMGCGMDLRMTEIALGYSVQQERNNFFWADIIVLQFPVYWFSVPAGLKGYMDRVFEYEQFYSFGKQYGSGGLLKGKKYCLSSTWNAPESEFSSSGRFFDGKSQDDVLVPVHKAMQFCGLDNLVNLSLHDVVKNPGAMKMNEKMSDFVEALKYAHR